MSHLHLTTILQLALAGAAAATGSAAGLLAAVLVLAVVVARDRVRQHLRVAPGGSVAVRARVLAAPQRPRVLDPAGGPREPLAGPDEGRA